MSRVVVIGNATVDLILTVDHLPRPGETVLAREALRCAGGKGLNQAVAASRLGVSTILVAPIGADGDGAFLRQALEDEATLAPQWLASPHATDTSIISIAADGENSIVSTAASARWLAPAEAAAIASGLTSGDVLVVQGNLSEAATAAALDAARLRGATTILNTAPIAWDQQRVAGLASIVVANAGEAEALTGLRDEDAALRLIAGGAGAVLITRGGGPALLAEGDRIVAMPVPAVDVLDTSGAGDVTVGTLAGVLAQGGTLVEGLQLALAAASLSVTRRGTTPSFPSRAELQGLARRVAPMSKGLVPDA